MSLPEWVGNMHRRHPWLTLLVCLAIGAVVSVLLRQDANWDLLNYHWYNPWAWLHGRLHTDLAAAGPQTFFNPLLDVPYYAMASGPLGHWPRVVAGVQGLWYGALIFVLWRLIAQLVATQARALDWGDLAALVIGVSGSAVIAQVGTTFNEVPLAVLVLAALGLLLRGEQSAANHDAPRMPWRTCLAGALVGLAAGLKPTAIIYAPALGVAVLVAAPRGQRGRLVAGFTACATLTFLLAYGWWGWWLYRTTGNPLFPLFNNVFQSDWVPAVNGTDARFRPHDVWQWLFYPFYWTVHRVHLVSEPSMLDGRFAFAWLATVLLGLRWMLDTVRRRRPVAASLGQTNAACVLLFVLVGYVCWLALFSIMRYAIPVEALTGVVIMMAVRRLWPSRGADAAQPRRYGFNGIAIGLTLLLLVGTQRPDWDRVDYAATVFRVRVPSVPDHSLILMVDQPHAYLAPFFHARDLSFVGVTWLTGTARGYKLWSMTQQRIDAQRGPIYAVLGKDGDSNSQRVLLPLLGLRIMTPCRAITSNLEPRPARADPSTGLRVCAVVRKPG